LLILARMLLAPLISPGKRGAKAGWRPEATGPPLWLVKEID